MAYRNVLITFQRSNCRWDILTYNVPVIDTLEDVPAVGVTPYLGALRCIFRDNDRLFYLRHWGSIHSMCGSDRYVVREVDADKIIAVNKELKKFSGYTQGGTIKYELTREKPEHVALMAMLDDTYKDEEGVTMHTSRIVTPSALTSSNIWQLFSSGPDSSRVIRRLYEMYRELNEFESLDYVIVKPGVSFLQMGVCEYEYEGPYCESRENMLNRQPLNRFFDQSTGFGIYEDASHHTLGDITQISVVSPYFNGRRQVAGTAPGTTTYRRQALVDQVTALCKHACRHFELGKPIVLTMTSPYYDHYWWLALSLERIGQWLRPSDIPGCSRIIHTHATNPNEDNHDTQCVSLVFPNGFPE